jgi:hypothetical protein
MAEKLLKTVCVFFILPIFILSGCNEGKADFVPEIKTNFSAEFEAEYNESIFKGNVSSNRQKVATINITYPETISGIKISYRSSEMKLCREELVCSADEAYLPETSLPRVIKSIFDGIIDSRAVLTNIDGNVATYTLTLPTGTATLKAENSLLTQAQINDINLTINFSNINTSSN